jgi:hypothetical protein
MNKILMMILVLLCSTTVSANEIVDEWSAGLGESPESVLSYLFEVSFMKIDIAVVEAMLSQDAANEMNALADQKERVDQAAQLLFDTETIAFGMTFQRDGGIGKFIKGIQVNLERAMKVGLITAEQHALVRDEFNALMEPHDERGAHKGDRLLFRIDPQSVRTIFLGVDDDLLVDSTSENEAWVRGIKGVFLGKDSKLRKKLIEQAWK